MHDDTIAAIATPPSPRRSAKADWPLSGFPARKHLPLPIKYFFRLEKVR
jgi:hypothetical protein